MRKEGPFRGIGSNLGACFVWYLAVIFLGRLYPGHCVYLLAGGIVFWVALPYAELFWQRMTCPIPRAMPKKRERLLIASALVRTKPR
jgi:hypothetical protein